MQAWADIEHRYTDGLVLGNGASMAFDGRFGYASLLDSAQQAGLVDANVNKVFQHLKTADFELVLRMLWHASMINEALGVEDDRTTKAYEAVRDSLITVVGMIHVPYDEVAGRLLEAARFMRRFSTVASLNYDLLVYWAMMAGMADGLVHFKDCFNAGPLDDDWERFRYPLPGQPVPTLVFYPHGNLVLASDTWGSERKIHAADADLLAAIFARWESGEMAPVFVSEGTPEQKMASIRRSAYLSTVYDRVLPRLGGSIVFYGYAFGDQDRHLLNSILRGQPSRIAVSVDGALEGPELDELTAHIRREISDRMNGHAHEVEFFDWRQGGCWVAS